MSHLFKTARRIYIHWKSSETRRIPMDGIFPFHSQHRICVQSFLNFIFFPKAALGYDRGNSITFECAGTVISEFFILTAAHCTKENHAPILVRLGKLNLQDENVENYHVQVAKPICAVCFFPFNSHSYVTLFCHIHLCCRKFCVMNSIHAPQIKMTLL